MNCLWVAKQDAESVPQAILYLLEKWGLQMEYLRGQGCDGVSSMSGHLSGETRHPPHQEDHGSQLDCCSFWGIEKPQPCSKRAGILLSRCLSGSLQCRQCCTHGNRIWNIAENNNNCFFYFRSQTILHFWISYREKQKTALHRQSSKEITLKSFFLCSTPRGNWMTLVIMWLMLGIFLKAFILII